MPDSYRGASFLDLLRHRYRFILIVVAAAMATAGAASMLTPKRYTATVTVLIDPPGVGDPRLSTAVSPAYLESLKSFEQFASSDYLFLKACGQFNLLAQANGASVERLKQRVLVVEKLKDTRLLRISVTLQDPKLAHEVAQYVAQQTVLLNASLAQEGDSKVTGDLAQQLDAAKATLAQARGAAAALRGVQSEFEEEAVILRELNMRTEEDALETSVEAAESSAQEKAITNQTQSADADDIRQKAARAVAGQAALVAKEHELAGKLAEKETAWVASRASLEKAEGEVESAQAAYNDLRKRANDFASGAGLRSEQLTIVDPGIVPQRPSAPDIPLMLAAAFALSLTAALVFLTLHYRLSRVSTRPARTEFGVARGGR